jgi:hypothetical protein
MGTERERVLPARPPSIVTLVRLWDPPAVEKLT